MSPQGALKEARAEPGNWYQVQSEADIFTSHLEEGINGSLIQCTVEVK